MEDSKMGLASASVCIVKWDFKGDCCQFFCPKGEFQLTLASLDALPEQQMSLAKMPIKLLPLCWSLENVRFFSVPLKSGVFFLYFSDSLKCELCLFSKPYVLVLIFLVRDPWTGQPTVELRPLTPWGRPLRLCYPSCL